MRLRRRKKLIRTFIRELILDPEKQEVRVSFYPDFLVHSIGQTVRKVNPQKHSIAYNLYIG